MNGLTAEELIYLARLVDKDAVRVLEAQLQERHDMFAYRVQLRRKLLDAVFPVEPKLEDKP